MEKPKTHFENVITETPTFVDTKNPIFYAFRGFLWELENNFTPKIPEAKNSLSDLVAFVFDAFYKNVVNHGEANIDTVVIEEKLKARGEQIWFKS